MDEFSRMMHFNSMAYSHHQQQLQQHVHNQQQQQQQHQDDRKESPDNENGEGIRGHANIGLILDQIMNITEQSLDEAQVCIQINISWALD